eukprot:Gb_39132 [translate_table: standard]
MSWYSWWTGSLGARARQQHVGDESEPELQVSAESKKRVGLIIGVTGIVGNSLAEILAGPDIPGGPWKVYGVARRPKPHWLSDEMSGVEYIQCDVLDREQTLQKISALTDVTHLFWVTWVSRETEEDNCVYNGQMFSNVLDALLPNAEGIEHICLQTGVYAALCKKEGMEFRYPGNWVTWEGFMDASDADLVAEQQIWAAIESNGKNQAFNVTNGDVFRWKQLWRVIAEKMGVEVGSYDGQGFSMAEEMKDKGNLWDTIVKENGLVETKIEQVGQWWFVDRILNRSFENVGSMNKSKKFGFFGFRNTENCCLQWIDRLRDHKIIP